MIIVKREFQDLDPNDAALIYRWQRDAAEEKLLQEWIDLKADMVEKGQRSPLLVDKIYDEDFVLQKTYVTDGFRRWIAVKSDELNWDTINAIVTTWVAQKNAIQVKPTAVSDTAPMGLQIRPEFAHTYTAPLPEEGPPVIDGDSAELAAHKAPADFSSLEDWLAASPGMNAEDYTAAKTDYDTNYKPIWANVDGYIAANGQPENMIRARREMKLDGHGHVYFGSMIVNDREDSLAVVSCRERDVTIAAVNVRTLDRTGTQPGA